MLAKKLKDYRIILASQSPRRQSLLKELGLTFETVINGGVDEVYPVSMPPEDIPVYLAELKAGTFNLNKYQNPLLIAADTIVWCRQKVMNKPANHEEAVQMLRELSGSMHEVITGVCLLAVQKKVSFSSLSKVFFKPLTGEEIDYYVTHYQPFDKAGAYGIQEWIGYIGIEKIEGSFYNVMGLPIQKLYTELIKF